MTSLLRTFAFKLAGTLANQDIRIQILSQAKVLLLYDVRCHVSPLIISNIDDL